MSFMLPGMPRKSQTDYVRGYPTLAGMLGAAAAVESGAVAWVRISVKETGDEGWRSLLPPGRIRYEVTATSRGSAAPEEAIDRLINEELALNAAADEAAEKATHTAFSRGPRDFPANRERSNDIINAVTMCHAAALQQIGLDADDPRRSSLQCGGDCHEPNGPGRRGSLRRIDNTSSMPSTSKIREAVIYVLHPDELPGSRKATQNEVIRIRSDRTLTALIASSDGCMGPGSGSRTNRRASAPGTIVQQTEVLPQGRGR